MALPEFTGEASLYQTAGHYQMAPLEGVIQFGRVVSPQFSFCGPCEGEMKLCCYRFPLPWQSRCTYVPCSTPVPPPLNPCAGCSSGRECCECGGGYWNGHTCF
jgi:hypothetical protein